MILEMMDGITKPPYARIKVFNRRYRRKDGSWADRKNSIELCFNIGAIRQCNLVKGERADLFYERYNETWKMPILIVRKDGTQRKFSGPRDGTWITLAIGAAVKQWDLPLVPKRRLEIIDYIDGDILIDITDSGRTKWLRKEERRRLVEKLSFTNSDGRSTTFKVTKILRDRIKIASRRENDRPMNQIIINALEKYLEENHPDI